MPFKLNNETAMDVLIWWIEGTDGSIDYNEEKAVQEVLEDMEYSLETYYQETLMYISGLENEKVKKLVDQAILWGKENFGEHRKKKTIALLEVIASCNGNITDEQQQKLNNLQTVFSVQFED